MLIVSTRFRCIYDILYLDFKSFLNVYKLLLYPSKRNIIHNIFSSICKIYFQKSAFCSQYHD